MKFEKNDKYFTICIYTVVSTLVVIGIAIALIKFDIIWGGFAQIIGRILELLKPLLIGIILAYLLDPIVEFYTKKCKNSAIGFRKKKNKDISRTIGTLLAIITIIAFIGLFTLIIILNVNTVLSSQRVEGLMASINQYIQYFQEMIEDVTGTIERLNLPMISTDLLSKIYGAVDQITFMITDKLISIIKGIGMNAISIGLGIVIALYMVQDKPRLLRGWNKFLDAVLSHRIRGRVRTVGKDLDYVFSGYIRGQLIDALIMAILTSLALTLIRLDFAVIIGIIAGIFNIIPYFGPVVGFVLAGIIGSIGPEPQKAIYAMAAVLILQQIDGWYIVPKVMGNSVKLHPIVVLLAIVIGGELFGLAGILLGVPVAAFIRITLIRYMGDVFG